MNRAVGVAFLIAGILLIIFGINASQSFSSEMSEFFTGSPSNRAIWLLVLGVVGTVIGLFLSLRPTKKQ